MVDFGGISALQMGQRMANAHGGSLAAGCTGGNDGFRDGWRLERHVAYTRECLDGATDITQTVRMATQEFLYDKETPKSVVINEAIEIARRFSAQESPQFINGILDSIRKELE